MKVDELFNWPAVINDTPCLQRRLPHHVLDLFPGGSCLVVVFEDARGPVLKPDPLREISGVRFVCSEGHTVLAVKTLKRDWYRGRPLLDFMTRLAQEGFFASFERVVFYGGSMGGYGALAFSCLAPGALVLAYSPQTTLDPVLVPWDLRYPVGRGADWTGPFGDAAVSAASAERVVVVYDPFERSDARQVARLAPDNLLALKLPFAGHGTPAMLAQVGELKGVLRSLLNGSLDLPGFARVARKRRQVVSYWTEFGRQARSLAVKRTCLRRADAIEPGTLPGLILQAEVSMADSDPAAAEVAARRGLAIEPRVGNLTEILVQALQDQGKTAEALTAARDALARYPKNFRIIRANVRLLQRQGDLETARSVVSAGLEQLPHHPRLLHLSRELTANPSVPKRTPAAGRPVPQLA